MDHKKLNVGDSFPPEDLAVLLTRMRYQKCQLVAQPGQFALRGGIVDVFPLTYRSPMRLEFEVDQIASIRDFSPQDGKSMACYDELFILPVTDTIERKIRAARTRFEDFEALAEHKDLVPGDIVVHLQYGIGRYLGTKKIQLKGKKKRHIAIEYAKGEILYLDASEPLERYIGGEGVPPKLTKLHTKEWERAKRKTRLAVHSVARDLLGLQAKRNLLQGYSFSKDQPWQQEFEAEFPFEETPDQLKATREVKKDMESDRPMDRLLCGDVGYGKTEVALRAAFKAVMSGKQAAILVPTTILAEQHYLVFQKRVKNFPISVEVLSRFQPRGTQTAVVASIKSGKTDIVIGTHRLLSKDVKFKDLGFVVIDEEQRFGVRHKEKLKMLRASVDILTLTATPIPRTLYMSVVGVRDMSVINTPPKSRLPIETHVMEYDDGRILDIFQRELGRGGQIYFIHNRVKSIDKIGARLKELMPHVRFGIAHGQMPAATLEVVMKDFLERRIDCLIATSIIESGIDIPNVNTIVVNRADSFGLSDLYQLRGRVGRYQEKRQAYAYFLTPKNWVLSLDAEKRLAAIERFTDLGSGFKIALEDLEIRGAGNLLGHQQSGFIHAVGFDLYCRMLRLAVNEEKTTR
ncbi:MAG: transcription-repair coupling factor [Candidatus Omnitrophota bacterium]|nr:transcription-repair coupling factor [Candidatus Omnitrophota bacterium]